MTLLQLNMDYIEISQSVFEQEISELQKVSNRIGSEMEQAVDLLYNCTGKAVVTGIGKTGLIGRKIAASLASTGTMAVFMNATDAIHGDLGMVGSNDVVIAISNSGSTQEITNILSPIRKIGAKLIAMTGDRNSPLGREADLILNVAVDGEACPLGQAPTTSTTATLVMGDALTICLMRKRSFQLDHYVQLHPGGTLGRNLLNEVQDLMSREIPLVYETDNFKDVIFVISDRRRGMTMVLNEDDKIIGIITDGDIRRAIQKYDDILSRKAADFMTYGFKKIAANAPVHDALELMKSNKITSVAVHAQNNSDEIIGLITIHNVIDFDYGK